MTPIISALAAGYGEDQVLEFIQRAFPSSASHVKKAIKSGYPSAQILKFLNSAMGGKPEDFEGLSEQQIHGKNREKDAQFSKNIAKTALGTAVGGLGGLAIKQILPRVASGAAQAIGASLPGEAPGTQAAPPSTSPSGSTAPQQIGPAPMSGAPTSPQQGASGVPLPTSAPASTSPPSTPNPIKQKATSIFADLGIEPDLLNMAKSGMTPKEISDYLDKALDSGQRKKVQKLLKETGISQEQLVKEALTDEQGFAREGIVSPQKIGQKNPNETPKIAENAQKEAIQDPKAIDFTGMGSGMVGNLYEGLFKALQEGKDTFAGIKDPLLAKAKPAFDAGLIKSPEDLRKFVNTPQKGEIVSSDNVVGEIKSIRNGEALIESDGKLHKVKADEIEQPSEDIRKVVHDYLAIPEEDRSSLVSLFTYDPQDNETFIQFHNGESYKYFDTPDEVVKEIASKNATPLTSGQNMYGIWSPDDKKSIGAALNKYIIKNPKYSKQNVGKTYKKMETHFDYYEKLRQKPKRPRK